MSLIGYGRADATCVALEETSLSDAGAVRVFVDEGETVRVADRPKWVDCLATVRAGDTLLVPALSAIANSEAMAVEVLADLDRRGVNIRSLSEPAIDSEAAGGSVLFGIVAVLGELRQEESRRATRRGLARARAEGRVGGRPSVMTPERTAAAVCMRAEGKSLAHIAQELRVGTSSVARALAASGPATAPPVHDRVFVRDVKPYFAPDSLDALHGPSGGVIELPHAVHWGPERVVDLDSPGGALKAYEAVLQEGGIADQAVIMNRDRLEAVWPLLALPARVRRLWEDRFPTLAETVHV